MLILLVRLFNILILEEVKRQILLIKLERLLVMSSLSVMELIKMFQKLFMLMLLLQFLQMLEMSRCNVVKIVSRLYVKLVQQSNKLCCELMEVIQLASY